MNQQETVGALANGGSYRATSYMVELTSSDGALVNTIDVADIKSVQRSGQRVILKRNRGADVVVEAASLDDAGRLQATLQPGASTVPQAAKKGGVGRFLLIGCGGLVALVVVVVVIAAAAGGGGDDKDSGVRDAPAVGQSNEAALAPDQSATAEGLKITLLQIADPFMSSNQFSRPSAGNRFVAFKVQIENVSNSDQFANAFNFSLTDAENFQHRFASVVFDEQSLVGQATTLSGGGKVEGWIGFEVKEGVGLKELSYDPNPVTRTDHHFRAP